MISVCAKKISSNYDVCDVVAKRTSMFDDPAVEIQELTSVVKQDITALNAAISDLQQICELRNDGANQTRQSSEHSTTVVDTLKSRLMNTTKEFKDVLTLRTEVSFTQQEPQYRDSDLRGSVGCVLNVETGACIQVLLPFLILFLSGVFLDRCFSLFSY